MLKGESFSNEWRQRPFEKSQARVGLGCSRSTHAHSFSRDCAVELQNFFYFEKSKPSYAYAVT